MRLFERKLSRALSDAEKMLRHERLHSVGPERLGGFVVDLDAGALSVWLADAK